MLRLIHAKQKESRNKLRNLTLFYKHKAKN